MISVIVPIYNVEKFLRKCVDSIINQTYKNIEIILVDDGSKDNCGTICDEYGKIDNRIKVIHKKNGGLSDARNAGLDMSTGECIVFVDSDDYINNTMIENLYNGINKYDADISCCAKCLENENGMVLEIKNRTAEYCISNTEAIEKFLLREEIDNSAWDKMYRRELFNEIRFPYGKYYEDIPTIYKLFCKANKIAHIGSVEYHYIIRNGSIINSNFSEKQLDSLEFISKIRNDININYPQYVEQVNSMYYLDLMTNLQKIKNSSDYYNYKNLYKRLKKEFNLNFINILKNKFITVKKKIMCILIYLNMFKLVKLLKHNIKGRV